MRKVVMVLALLVVTGLFALKQYGENDQNEKSAQPKAPEIWENVRKVYDISQSRTLDAEMSLLGNSGFQVAAVQIVSAPDGSRFYEIYYKRRVR